jgi:DNA invertase Pin-like site-specific DNA recombinase
MISARTNAALAAAKRRGVKLGGDRGARLTAKARAAGRAALQERVRNRARIFSRRHDSRATGGRL